MSNATIRSQFIDYNLIRSGRLSPTEAALLQIIGSFSEYCASRQADIAKMMNRSTATVKRATTGLLEKGYITKTYTLFKRCVLKVVPLEKQKALLGPNGALRQIFKLARLKRKRPDSSPVSQLNSSPVSQSTRKETAENKTKKIELNFSENREMPKGRMTDKEFMNEKMRQLAMLERMIAGN
jgi:DNA-binding MarR family transcriptional regulator